MSYKLNRIINTVSFLNKVSSSSLRDKHRALYFGWLGHRNLGDEALYYCIKEIFLKNLFFYTSGEFRTLFMKDIMVNFFDVYFLGGGTLINRSDDVMNALVWYKQHISKSIVFGTGVANDIFWKEFEDRVDRSDYWREYLNSCIFVGVRGPDSLRYMQDLGVPKSVMIGDPVLYLGRDKIVAKCQKKRIGLNFGNTSNKLWGKSDRIVEDAMLDLIRLLLEQHWDVSFFNVYGNDTSHYFDFVERNSLESKIRFFDASDCSIETALAYFDTIDVFVGEKLHASVLAACTSTPFIMLEYRPKCLDFMRSINCEKYNFRTDAIDVDEIFLTIEELYQMSGDVQKYIHKNVSFLKNLLIFSSRNIFNR